MHKHHVILLAPLSLCLLATVACDLPAAPVGKDALAIEDEDEDDAPVCEGYDPCAGTEGQLGFYGGWVCGPLFAQVVINTNDISCNDALANCLLNESTNAENGTLYYCEWDGFEIHRSHDPEGYCEELHGPAPACEDLGPQSCVVPEDPCEGQEGWQDHVHGFACNSDVFAPTIDGAPAQFSCEDALALCADYLAAHPDLSLSCLWNGKALMYNEAVAGECATLEPC